MTFPIWIPAKLKSMQNKEWKIASDFPTDLEFIKPCSWAYQEVTALKSTYFIPKLSQKQETRLQYLFV